MKLIIECERGPHVEFTGPDAIVAALVEAGVLEVEWDDQLPHGSLRARVVSPWKEAK